MMKTAADVMATKPWNSLGFGLAPSVKKIPTMLTDEESRMLAWITQYYFSGEGAICELGSFVGGSTARLASGLTRNPNGKGHIYSYDRFGCAENMKQNLLYRHGIKPFEGEDILPLARELLREYDGLIDFWKGDMASAAWRGGPIEILFIDVAKTARLADHIAEEFFPSLIAGRSLVIQQDYQHYATPWDIAQMELLADCFRLAGWTENFSAVFLCTQPVTAEKIRAAKTDTLSDAAMIALVEQAIMRFPHVRQRECLAQGIVALHDHPGNRLSWQFKRTAQDPVRTASILQDLQSRREAAQ